MTLGSGDISYEIECWSSPDPTKLDVVFAGRTPSLDRGPLFGPPDSITRPMPCANDIVPQTAIQPKKHDQRTSQPKAFGPINGIGPSSISNETIIMHMPVIRSRIPFARFKSAVSRAVRFFLSFWTSLPSNARATTSRAMPQARQNRPSSAFSVAHFGQYTRHLSSTVLYCLGFFLFGNVPITPKVPVR